MSFSTSLETVTKLTGLLVVAGYVSLRAHFNTLGISSLAYLGFERYLMETLVFVVEVGWRALGIGLLGCIAVVGFLHFPRAKSVGERIVRHPWGAIAIVVVLATILSLVVLRVHTTDIIVGRLDTHVLLDRSEWVFYLDLVVVMIAAIVFRPLRERLRDVDVPAVTAFLWRVSAGLVIVLAVLLPMLFGHFLHPTSYPLIMLKSDGRWQDCAIAIYQSEKGLVVWQVKDGFGRVFRFAGSHDIVTGPLKDVRAIAAIAAQGSGSYPTCDDLGKL